MPLMNLATTAIDSCAAEAPPRQQILSSAIQRYSWDNLCFRAASRTEAKLLAQQVSVCRRVSTADLTAAVMLVVMCLPSCWL